MRFHEAMQEERKVPEKKGKKKEEDERILAGDKDYDYYELGKNRPMRGGNSWS